jgi:hypothetical protein
MGSLIYWADQGNPDWRNILDREFVEMQSRKAMQLTEEELANLLQDN